MSDTKQIEIDSEVIAEVSKQASETVSKELDEKLKGLSIPTAEIS